MHVAASTRVPIAGGRPLSAGRCPPSHFSLGAGRPPQRRRCTMARPERSGRALTRLARCHFGSGSGAALAHGGMLPRRRGRLRAGRSAAVFLPRHSFPRGAEWCGRKPPPAQPRSKPRWRCPAVDRTAGLQSHSRDAPSSASGLGRSAMSNLWSCERRRDRVTLGHPGSGRRTRGHWPVCAHRAAQTAARRCSVQFSSVQLHATSGYMYMYACYVHNAARYGAHVCAGLNQHRSRALLHSGVPD